MQSCFFISHACGRCMNVLIMCMSTCQRVCVQSIYIHLFHEDRLYLTQELSTLTHTKRQCKSHCIASVQNTIWISDLILTSTATNTWDVNSCTDTVIKGSFSGWDCSFCSTSIYFFLPVTLLNENNPRLDLIWSSLKSKGSTAGLVATPVAVASVALAWVHISVYLSTITSKHCRELNDRTL